MKGLRAGWIAAGLLVALAIGAGAWIAARRSAPTNAALDLREAAARRIGQWLAEHARGQNVLVLSNPFTRDPGRPGPVYAFEAAGIRGLDRGWRGQLHLEAIVFPPIESAWARQPEAAPIDPASPTPLSYLLAADAWDQLLRQHPKADIWVSLIGVPLNLSATKAWRQPDRPGIALLLPDMRMLGAGRAIESAFRSGKLLAVVLNRPRPIPPDTGGSTSGADEFDRHFLLVTADNVAEVHRRYPDLWP
ncbi:MAG TPA: hypothetical protein P5555_03015 [Candidatus Paceibacterota bacterium]|nr:hypothetical protein [Verrucomicrobiota bacterium]HRZ44143.1 hypothetical protein [Candidatus Paceibacterota bacterium]HRZ91303.1 hypothetical protein [Candidatus Paceibacterota bacterium]